MIDIRNLTKLYPARDRPVTDLGRLPEATVLDVTFHGDSSAQPLISQLARTYSVDVTILSAAIETVNGYTVGRMRIGLPGRFEENVVPIGFLRERGLNVEVAAASTSGAGAVSGLLEGVAS